MTERKKVLFVDDEQRVLDGIRRMMQSMKGQWDLFFANSGEEALKLLEQGEFDVIVSDMRMPGMTGTELLEAVQIRYPHMVRIALSGEAHKEQIMNSVGPIHQYLSKPCDADTIKNTLVRSNALRHLLGTESLRQIISRIETLPSLPSLYTELMEELSRPEASLKKVEGIISKDLGMMTKVLQLVNSAFFGVQRHVSSPGEAVRLLGLDTIQSLVLSVQIFTQFEGKSLESISLKGLWDHSMIVGSCSKAIAKAEKAEPLVVDDAFIAGLLHDVGKLILASNVPEEYTKIRKLYIDNEISFIDAERDIIGTTHAEVGAYLLCLWGFSDSIVEAVGFHHEPMVGLHGDFSPLTTTHIANMIVCENASIENGKFSEQVDEEYLSALGLMDRLEGWREIVRTIMEQDGET